MISAVRISPQTKWHLRDGCEWFKKISDSYKEFKTAEENDPRIEDNLCKYCKRMTTKKSKS